MPSSALSLNTSSRNITTLRHTPRQEQISQPSKAGAAVGLESKPQCSVSSRDVAGSTDGVFRGRCAFLPW